MHLSRIISKINGDFSRKSQNFPPTCILRPLLKGFHVELGIGAGGQKTRLMGYRAEQAVCRYLQPCGSNAPTWRTDGRTPGDSKDRAIHIASRGNKTINRVGIV